MNFNCTIGSERLIADSEISVILIGPIGPSMVPIWLCHRFANYPTREICHEINTLSTKVPHEEAHGFLGFLNCEVLPIGQLLGVQLNFVLFDRLHNNKKYVICLLRIEWKISNQHPSILVDEVGNFSFSSIHIKDDA